MVGGQGWTFDDGINGNNVSVCVMCGRPSVCVCVRVCARLRWVAHLK